MQRKKQPSKNSNIWLLLFWSAFLSENNCTQHASAKHHTGIAPEHSLHLTVRLCHTPHEAFSFTPQKDTLVSERTGLFTIIRISSHCLGSTQQLGDSNVYFMRNHRFQIYIYFATSLMIHFQQHPRHVRAWPAVRKTTEGKKQICMSPLIELALGAPVLTDPGQLLLHCSIWLVQYPQYFGSHPVHLQRFQRFLNAHPPPRIHHRVICNDHVSDPWWSEKRT